MQHHHHLLKKLLRSFINETLKISTLYQLSTMHMSFLGITTIEFFKELQGLERSPKMTWLFFNIQIVQ